jgi:hypothetical protein
MRPGLIVSGRDVWMNSRVEAGPNILQTHWQTLLRDATFSRKDYTSVSFLGLVSHSEILFLYSLLA